MSKIKINIYTFLDPLVIERLEHAKVPKEQEGQKAPQAMTRPGRVMDPSTTQPRATQ